MKEIPTFAVTGEPNEGKTTVVATLAEDDSAQIGPRAGTTKERIPYTVKVDGRPVMQFIDTPGFENTPQLRVWLEEQKNTPGDLAERFIAEHESDPRFKAECEILKALRGAAIIYVVDGTRRIRQDDIDQVEILRLCSSNRIAVINREVTHGECLRAWEELLSRAFTWQYFDAHHVTFHERIQLLKKIAVVMPAWENSILQSIRIFEEAWEGRLRDCRDYLMEFLEESFNCTVTAAVTERHQLPAAAEKAKAELHQAIRQREKAFRDRIRKTFHHRRADWMLPQMSLLQEDLFSERVWRLLGLNGAQLIWAGAAAGAISGGLIDMMLGFTTFFTGAMIGAAAGAVAGWLAADKSVDIKLPAVYLGSWRMPGLRIASNRSVEARAHVQSNLLWILIDRALLYIQAAAQWSHGRRETDPDPIELAGERIGISTRWSNETQAPIIEWIGMLRRGNSTGDKFLAKRREVQAMLLREVDQVTRTV